MVTSSRTAIGQIELSTYKVHANFPESDGAMEWNSTALVLVHARGGNRVGLGFTCADTATGTLIRELPSGTVRSQEAMSPAASWNVMAPHSRNLGRSGIVAAISAVDAPLWGLKARLLDLALLSSKEE